MPPEPDDNFVTVKVRHLSMGVCAHDNFHQVQKCLLFMIGQDP